MANSYKDLEKILENKKNNYRLNILNSEDFLESDIATEKGFLIDRLIPEGSVGMLVAPAKCNKTTLAYNIALSVATGEDCISHKTIKSGKVLFISIEGSITGIINTFGYSKNLDILADKYFQWEDYKQELEERIKENEYKLIVIDPLYKATKCDIAKADKIRPFLINIEQLAATYNCTFLLCHHTMRANSLLNERTVNDISGSMHLQRSSEFTIMLEEEKKTEEEEREELFLTQEEFEALPKKRILRKHDYRYGKEGFTKYLISIDFNNGVITGERYNSVGIRVAPSQRIEDLFNNSIEIISNFPVIDKGMLSDELSKVYTGLSKNSIKNRYVPKVFDELVANGYIQKTKGHKYAVVNNK